MNGELVLELTRNVAGTGRTEASAIPAATPAVARLIDVMSAAGWITVDVATSVVGLSLDSGETAELRKRFQPTWRARQEASKWKLSACVSPVGIFHIDGIGVQNDREALSTCPERSTE